MPIQKLETTNVLKQWMDTINTIIDDSSELESRLNEKVDKETGKGLSTNDFTNTLKDKLDSIEEGANNYTLPTANNAMKGGVTLSDSTSSESGTDDGIAATPKAVKIAYDLASKALPKAGGTIEGDLTVTGKINATIEGNTDTANQLSVARTIALTGDVSGSTTFDGSKDVSITVTVADDSHSHTIDNIDNLETLLATKAGITSPSFAGTPKAPTAKEGTNTTQIATTAFVNTAVNNAIDGAVFGPETSSVGNIAIFNDANGNSVSDSGFTIASSVPANAKFTDTTYNVGSSVEAGITKLYNGIGNNTDGTITQDVITTLFENKLGAEETAVRATSDASGNVITTTYATKEELSNIGDSLADVATSGSYNDLTNKPTSLKNPTSLTIQNSAGTSVGTYDGSTATTVKLTSATVGLGNVTNESKATMFTSPVFTGTPTAPTATAGTNTTQVATTAFVSNAIAELVDSAPETLNTLGELASALSENVDVTDALNEAIATKAPLASPVFTGFPTAPTAIAGTNTTQIATTAFVNTSINNKATSDASTYATKIELNDLNAEVVKKANDSDVVKLNNEQTISGVKTFSSIISGSISGNAGTSDKLSTSRTIALTGDVSGSTTFDGSKDVSITVTVADDSHSHTVANIDNLETLLASKADITSPSFTGTPTAPTAPVGTNTTQVATTAFVNNAVESAVDGAVFGPSTSTDSTVAVFDGTTGKLLKDSGYTIASSVPANAKFTDTTYTGSNGISLNGTTFSNSGVRSVSSGTANGTISVNTNGTSADVAVKGLGSAAFTNSSDYLSITGGNITGDLAVDGLITGNIEGNAASADVLTVKDTGNVNTPVYFSGGIPVALSYTIASDVPANAKFTDTTYTVGTTNYSGTTKLYTSTGSNTDGTINQSALTTLLSGKLGATDTAVRATSDENGNNIASTYATKTELENIGDSLADVATSGSYNDLTDKPTSLKNPTTLILQNSAGTNIGTYDGSSATTVKLQAATVGLGNVTNESKATMFTSPALTGTPTAPTAANTTNTTQIATTAFVQSVVDSKIAAADAMIYKGTIGTGGTVTALPNTHSTGWTYKVITAGTYAGVKCNVGDMIICLTDGTAANNTHWTVVEGNIDGAVTGPTSSVANNVAIFDGATGKVIKDSGFSIASSVPANAKFTDTTYTVGTTSYSGTTKLYSGIGNNVDGTITQKGITDSFVSKEEFEDFKTTGETLIGANEISWVVTNAITNNSVVTIPESITYPYNTNSIIVSVDGTIISKDINYEEVGTNIGEPSNKIKFLFDVEVDSIIKVWVSPQAKMYGDLTFIQETIDITNENVEKCRYFYENIDSNVNVSSKAPLNSPNFTGTPTAPTAPVGTNTTQIATTEFVATALANTNTSIEFATKAEKDSDGNIITTTYATKEELSEIEDAITTVEESLDSFSTVATSGSYNDLTDKPTALKNPTSLTIQNSAGTSVGVYDGSETKTIVITSDVVGLGNVTNESKSTMFTSPNFTGTPTAPTATAGTNTTQVATTAFVTTALNNAIPEDAVFTDTTYTGSNGISLNGTTFSNSGVRSVSSGTANGTISVNTNGTSADVAVKGLGSAAFTSSTTYAASSHTSVTANGNTLGHVKLSDSIDSTSGVSNGVAATPAAVKSAYDLANSALPKTGGTITGLLKTKATASTISELSGTSINVSDANVFTKTITANTTFTITGTISGMSSIFTLILIDGGSKTVTWPTTVKWPYGEVPELTASGKDILTFITVDGGLNWYGAPSIINAL